MRRKPQRVSRAALRAYAKRKRDLTALGFSSYEAYLLSPLWGRIRTEKLRETNNQCYGCGSRVKPVQVHHASYERAVLQGKAPHLLFVVCEDCHKEIEFFAGWKVGPKEATARLEKIRERVAGHSERPADRRAKALDEDFSRLLDRDA